VGAHASRRPRLIRCRSRTLRRALSSKAVRNAGGCRYALWMDSTGAGELVKVGGDGPERDGIVFDTPSRSKVVVAVVHPGRGPVFRTVPLSTLSERTEDGPDDRALRMLLRRTPPPVRGTAGGGVAAGRGRPGHARGAMHRTTGK